MWFQRFHFQEEISSVSCQEEKIYSIVHVMLQTDRKLEHVITCQNMFLVEMVSYYMQSPIQGTQM